MKYLILTLCTFLTACNSGTQPKQNTADSVVKKDSTQNIPSPASVDSAEINISLDANQLPTTVHQNINNDNQHLYIHIKNIHAKEVVGNINTPDSRRNIRFSQIIMPDSTADGPFTDSIRYSTKQKGNYILIIGKNNMAEGTLKGAVSVSLSLH